jgi:hypothetical protein
MTTQIKHPVLQRDYENIIDWMVENSSEDFKKRVLEQADKIYKEQSELILAVELARIRILDEIKMG